jgi:hypothetical protein
MPAPETEGGSGGINIAFRRNYPIKNVLIMRNRIKLSRILLPAIFLLCFGGCEKEKWEVPTWSHAVKFADQLKRLQCVDAGISVKEVEWPWYTWNTEEGMGSIIGTWQLLLELSAGDTIDRSCTPVYYTFHADGTATIESVIKEIPSGTFTYEYYLDPYCPMCDPPQSPKPNLIIGENESYCQLSPSWLVTLFVRYRDVDGEILTTSSGDFEKIYHKIN